MKSHQQLTINDSCDRVRSGKAIRQVLSGVIWAPLRRGNNKTHAKLLTEALLNKPL